MTRHRLTMIAAALTLAVATAACSAVQNVPVQSASGSSDSPRATAPVAATVTLVNTSFAPAVVTINAGQTVELKWNDGQVPHNVTFATLWTETEPAGIAFDGTIHGLTVWLPAAWYIKLTATNATLGTTAYY